MVPKTGDNPKTKLANGTKENKPDSNESKVRLGQTTMHGFLSPSKARSPHSHSPLSLLHEENSSQASNVPNGNLKQEEVKQTENTSSTTPDPQEAIKGSSSTGEGKPLEKPPKSSSQNKNPATKTSMKKPEKSDSQGNRKVTDYYPIRRSSRKSKAELKNEQQQHIEELIKNNVEDGLEVRHLEGKGRGVFAGKPFRKGQFVVEYHGDLVEMAEAKKREGMYAQDPSTGCYMYYFQFNTKTYCVDATKETERLGRLLNHSKTGNCQTKLHSVDGRPHLILVASRDISLGEELLYDYGDRSKEAIAAHPWLKH